MEMGRGSKLLWAAFAAGVVGGVVACSAAMNGEALAPTSTGAPSIDPTAHAGPASSGEPQGSGPAEPAGARTTEPTVGIGAAPSGAATTTPVLAPSEGPSAPTTNPRDRGRAALPGGKRCEDFRGSSCPEGCGERCVGSCPMCDDCGGPGSCYTL